MSRGTVLIVEDDTEFRTALARIVQSCGFDVLTATDGEEATATLGTMHVDMVMTDLLMPRLDGYDLIRWMHKQNLTQPILAMSGQNSLPGAVEALRLGAHDYIAKPCTFEEVKTALRRLEATVEHRRTNAELRQRNRELAALNAISTAICSSLELNEMLEHALSALVEALELTGTAVYLNDPNDCNQLALHCSYGSSYHIAHIIAPMLPHPQTDGVALGPTQVAQLLNLDEGSIQHASEAVLAAIPLVEQGALIGILLLCGVNTHPIRHNQLALLTSIGNYLSVGVANTRLYDQVRHSALVLEQAVAQRTSELQRSRDLLRTIFDGIPDGLLLVDINGDVLAINRAYAAILDLFLPLTPNQTYDQIWLSTDAKHGTNLLQQCLTKGSAIYQRSRLERTGHSPIVLDHYLVPVRDETGTITQVIEYLEDVTDRLALERAFTQTEQIAALGKLAATVAHEVNTPLLAIRGCLGLIANPNNTPATRTECLTLAESELDRAADIIRVMLAFYQPTGHERRTTDVNLLIEQIAQLLRAELVKHSIDVRLHLTPALPAIFVVPDQLKQVILNLMLNAIEALPNGGNVLLRTSLRQMSLPPPRDSSNTIEHDQHNPNQPYVVLEVEDTGSGIPAALQEKIFDAFVTTKPDGSGLGLAVSRTIVHDQGGTIEVQNLPDGGACFTVAFPTAVEDMLADEHEQATHRLRPPRVRSRTTSIAQGDFV